MPLGSSGLLRAHDPDDLAADGTLLNFRTCG
jgi:hypothetical protein